MAEVTLKKKITLKRKEEQVDFYFDKLLVQLIWTPGSPDLDLCLFFKKKNGEVGGVFSNEYRGKKTDLGSLDNFPFILHMGDDKGASGEKTETIKIANLDEIDIAYLCIVNYAAAIDGKDVTFAEESGRIEVKSNRGDYLEVLADSKEDGHVYCVCSIKNNDGVYALKNESNVMDLSTAFDKIPGFSLICNE